MVQNQRLAKAPTEQRGRTASLQTKPVHSFTGKTHKGPSSPAPQVLSYQKERTKPSVLRMPERVQLTKREKGIWFLLTQQGSITVWVPGALESKPLLNHSSKYPHCSADRELSAGHRTPESPGRTVLHPHTQNNACHWAPCRSGGRGRSDGRLSDRHTGNNARQHRASHVLEDSLSESTPGRHTVQLSLPRDCWVKTPVKFQLGS